MVKKILCLLIAVTSFFTACQKGIDPFTDNNNGNTGGGSSDLKGTWNFVHFEEHASSTTNFDLDGSPEKYISLTNFISNNNAGTLVIDDSMLTSTGYSYSVDTTYKTYVYEDNAITDSIELPLNVTLPATNSSAKYQLINSDSIYLPEGSNVTTNGTTTQSPPSGAKFNINGDILTITSRQQINSTKDSLGLQFHIVNDVLGIETFKRK